MLATAQPETEAAETDRVESPEQRRARHLTVLRHLSTLANWLADTLAMEIERERRAAAGPNPPPRRHGADPRPLLARMIRLARDVVRLENILAGEPKIPEEPELHHPQPEIAEPRLSRHERRVLARRLRHAAA